MSKDEAANQLEALNLPVGAAISWGLVKPPKRGPKREMSIEQIVKTAVAIADKDGIAAVSMNRVASALGFTAMSLYRYIPSKNDLLLLMQEAVSEITIPPEKEPADWRENMREYVNATIKVFRDHPWFGDIPISSVPVTPNNLQYVDWILRTMRDFPLSDYEKMSILLLLSSYARSCGIIQRDMVRAVQAGSSPEDFSGLNYTEALKALVKPSQFPYLHPVVMSGVYTGENEADNPVDNDFDFGLERILDGIGSYMSKQNK
ncbi:TetR/AcrR family transcriptional regulator [Paenibacillus sp. sgz500958]|uniref:TetR/AcrR family transcriptional regulator n=1 Tax=Paenibacillus sp. sgz500958 TaxID=3242475 RepID=UPI0036D32312